MDVNKNSRMKKSPLSIHRGWLRGITMKKFIIIMMLITNCTGTQILVTGNYYYKEKNNYKGCKENERTEVEKIDLGDRPHIIIALSPIIITFIILGQILILIIDNEDFPYFKTFDFHNRDMTIKTQLQSIDCEKKIIRVEK